MDSDVRTGGESRSWLVWVGLGWNFEVGECPGAVLGSRRSQMETQHCWGLLGTVVTTGAGGELGLALGWDRGGGTGPATTSEGIRVFSLLLSHQPYESHLKSSQVHSLSC